MTFKASLTLADQIAVFLADRIIRLKLKPGERIIETKLAEELGTSKAPIREALRSLEKKHLVKIIPRKGATVVDVSAERFAWMADVIIELMGLAAVKCVENASPEELKAIDDFTRQCKETAERKDDVAYFEALLGFALACLAAAKNPILEELMTDLIPGPLRVIFMFIRNRSDELIENARIVEVGNGYIQSGNAKMANETVRIWATNEKEIGLKNIEQMGKKSK